MIRTGRYRWRTALRRLLPWRLIGLAPKGARDCGAHEWYRHDARSARCYHCAVGERPWTEVH
ncbi:hypothetical protein ACIRBX_14775 [Kitasatospora sp. NPDC096147]|uniref:hypothetical protein n=1 Tax=Kitasatospora sp. NPDC096147 TaxID=3364093 RepID=UPI0037F6C0A7